MNLPRRILDEGSGDWERKVLESAASDAPSPEFRKRVARELGVLASVATLTSTTTAAGQALGVLAWVKLLGAGAAMGLATMGVSYAVSNWSPGAPSATTPTLPAESDAPSDRGTPQGRESFGAPSVPMAAIPPPSEVHATDGVPAKVPAPSTTATARRGDLAEVSKAAPASPPASLRSRALMAETDSALSAELRVVERVRAALAAGDARAALSELDRYESAPGAKLFQAEAQVLRIEALARLGDDAGARTLARRFLAEHADSPYVRRVRSLIGESP